MLLVSLLQGWGSQSEYLWKFLERYASPAFMLLGGFWSVLQLRLKPVELKIEQKIASVEQKIASVEQRIEQKIASVEQRMEQKIASVEQRMEQRFTFVDQRIASLKDELMVKIDGSTAALKADLIMALGSSEGRRK
jgi:hypothetical protein